MQEAIPAASPMMLMKEMPLCFFIFRHAILM
jgi:hypothetical protein